MVPIRLVGGANNARFERPRRRPRPAEAVGWHPGRRVRSPEAGRASGVGLLESAGAAEAADRFEIEVIGGANRIVVVEA